MATMVSSNSATGNSLTWIFLWYREKNLLAGGVAVLQGVFAKSGVQMVVF